MGKRYRQGGGGIGSKRVIGIEENKKRNGNLSGRWQLWEKGNERGFKADEIKREIEFNAGVHQSYEKLNDRNCLEWKPSDATEKAEQGKISSLNS